MAGDPGLLACRLGPWPNEFGRADAPNALDGLALARFLEHIEQSILDLPTVVEHEFFRLAADAALHSYEVF